MQKQNRKQLLNQKVKPKRLSNVKSPLSQEQNRQFPAPREKSDLIGFESLSEADLISLILRYGDKSSSVYEISNEVARCLLDYKYGNVSTKDLEFRLSHISGMGYSKLKSVLAAIELSYRLHSIKEFVFNSPDKIISACATMRLSRQEKVVSIFLNSSMQMVYKKQSFCGTIDKTLISPREIFLSALKAKARYVVIVHNHPSGNAAPSDQDVSQTKHIKEIGDLLGINLLDHIIITKQSYFSFKEKGIL